MLNQMTPAREAGAMIQFLQHGRVLAITPAWDANHAEITARVLLRTFEQFDCVIIAPYQHRKEIERRPGKEARKAIKRAYKEGLI